MGHLGTQGAIFGSWLCWSPVLSPVEGSYRLLNTYFIIIKRERVDVVHGGNFANKMPGTWQMLSWVMITIVIIYLFRSLRTCVPAFLSGGRQQTFYQGPSGIYIFGFVSHGMSQLLICIVAWMMHSEWAWLCLSKILFAKPGHGLDLAHGSEFAPICMVLFFGTVAWAWATCLYGHG